MIKRFEKLRDEKDKIKKEVKKQVLTYVTATFGFVAGLAWNEAIKELIDYLFPVSNSLLAKFIYAIIMTFVVVIISLYLVRLFRKQKEEEKKG